MRNLVSVIMSTYNTQREQLDESIKSILKQTYENIEFIIICDGSKDDYEYIRKAYDDRRIKLILHSENKGLAASLNEGIRMSHGKYIARMDSDDISLKNRIQIQVEYLERNSKIQICGMFTKTFGDYKKKVKQFFYKPDEIEAQLLYTCCLVHPTIMFRKDYLIRNNYWYNEKFICAQDYDLWSRCCQNSNIAIINKYGLLYRVHSKQASKEKRKIQVKLTNEILNNNAKKISKEKNIDIVNCFKVLSFLEELNKDNYIKISDMIDYIIKNNNLIKKSVLTKVLYNRYFFLVIKNRLLKTEIKKILANQNIMKKIIKTYNIRFLLWGLIKRIGEK